MNSAWKTWSAAVLRGLVALVVSTYTWPQSPADGDDFRVTLLGTGTPQPLMHRFGPGVLVQVGGQTLLFDCGRGVTQRLFQLGVKLGAANQLFITHLHSDHIVGIPDLWLTGWLEVPFAQRKGAFQVFGPAGTRNMMENLEKAYEWDIRTRIADQKLAKENVAVSVTVIKESIVYDLDSVKVTAFEVDHGDLIKPAFGFRVNYGGRPGGVSGGFPLYEKTIPHTTRTAPPHPPAAPPLPPRRSPPRFSVHL